MMKYLLLLVSLLVCAWASPTPDTELSIFDDDAIPVVDQPDLEYFNFTALQGRDEGIEKRALSLTYVLYDVIFNGLDKGNLQPFRVKGELLVIKRIPSPGTQNGANPVDVVISIGNPAGNPMAGSIRYVTNRYLNPLISGSKDELRTDFARVSTKSGTVTVSVDTSIAAFNQLSVFNARSGLFADVYNPARGGFKLVVKKGKISGWVNFAGRGVISGASAPYKARIGGKAKQKGKISL
ncbi:hypothetical protein BKA56DRAFT_657092 [Ilyonectria sp. MPI-CAGE-AT-0026]|nr:hypothetical protein BKA56DRAFT_657092 [Ilyonectria sp. MPI-CAGE-AT-0026]